jgi:hypothetical protein
MERKVIDISHFFPLFLCLPTYLPTTLSTYVSIDLSNYLWICLPIFLSSCLTINLSIYLSIGKIKNKKNRRDFRHV